MHASNLNKKNKKKKYEKTNQTDTATDKYTHPQPLTLAKKMRRGWQNVVGGKTKKKKKNSSQKVLASNAYIPHAHPPAYYIRH